MKKLIKELTRWTLVAAVVGIFLVAGSAERHAMAMDVEVQDDEIASLEEGSVVRRQLLFRAGRFELEPKMMFSLNDAYVRNAMIGLSGSYFLNNYFGIGASFGFGALQFDTSMRGHLESGLDAQGGDALAQTSFSHLGWALDTGLIYVPAFGKLSIMNSAITHYDFHIFGGMAVVNESADAALEGATPDTVLEGIRPGGMFGLGMRFFVGHSVSMNFQVRNYLYTRAEVSQGSADPRLGNMVLLSLGFGFYFPGEVQISR